MSGATGYCLPSAYPACDQDVRGIVATEDELRLEIENLDLRRLLAQAGIDAAEQKTLDQLQRLVLEELHHRVKNTLATVMAISSQSLRTAKSCKMEEKQLSTAYWRSGGCTICCCKQIGRAPGLQRL